MQLRRALERAMMTESNLSRVAQPYGLYLAGLAAVAAALVLVETSRYGLGVSPDSVHYIQQARALAEPGALSGFLGAPQFATQPPLLPLLLACIERVAGADPLASLRLLNAALFALVVFGTPALVVARSRASIHPVIAGLIPVFVLLSRSLHEVFTMAWTEPLFIATTLLFLAAMARYMERGSPRALAFAAALTVIAIYTRYSGVTLIAAGVASIPFARSRSARGRAIDAAAFALSTSAAFGVWALRNLQVVGTPFGERAAAVYSFGENVRMSLGVFQGHLLPESGELALGAKLVLVSVVVALAAWAYVPHRRLLRDALLRERVLVVPCAAFAIVFTGFTIVTSSLVAYDPINFRLLSPATLPLLVIAGLFGNAALGVSQSQEPGARRLFLITVVLLLLVSIQPVRQFARDFSEHRTHGSGLSGRTWSESKLLTFLGAWDDRETGRELFSNQPAALRWHLDLSAEDSPRRGRCAALSGGAARSCFDAAATPEFFGGYLVHFSSQHYPYYYSLEELESLVDLVPVVETPDGGVYRVSRREP